MYEDAVNHIELMPYTISQIDVHCPWNEVDFPIFLHLSGDRVYTAYDKTLNVYSVRNLTDSIPAFSLKERCYSAKIVENRLYLCTSY